MSSGGDSPWSKRKTRHGPRLVGDGVASGATTPSQQNTRLPTGLEPPAAAAPSRGSGPKPRKAFSRSVIVALGAAAALVVIGVAWSLVSDGDGSFNVETAARSVAMVASAECGWTGSGSLVDDSGLVLTNSHVATDDGRDICLPVIGFTEAYDEEPTEWYQAVVLVDDPELDLAVLQVLNDDGSAVQLTDRDPIPLDTSTPNLGDQIQTLGYPGIGGQTMTFTSGDFAGVVELSGADFYKTTASLNSGVSGGSAFNGEFRLVGIPTAGRGAEVICERNDCTAFGSSLGLIRPVRYAVSLIEEAKRLAG